MEKKKWTLMIVEDVKEECIALFNRYQARYPDAFIVKVGSGVDAIDLLKNYDVLKDVIIANPEYKEFSDAIEADSSIINIGCIILDVVMETVDAGFKVVDYIRKTMNNTKIQIVIHSGQLTKDGEEKLNYYMQNYDVNSIIQKAKTTSSVNAVLALDLALISAKRYYDLICELEKTQNELKQKNEILKAIGKELSNCILESNEERE